MKIILASHPLDRTLRIATDGRQLVTKKIVEETMKQLGRRLKQGRGNIVSAIDKADNLLILTPTGDS